MNQDKKLPSVKKVAAAIAAVMLIIHTQGTIQQTAAAQAVVIDEAASLTDNTIPEGAKISSETAHKNVLKLFPELSKATLRSVQLGSGNTYPSSSEKDWDLSYSVTRGNSTSSFNATVSGQTGEVLSAYLPDYLISSGKSEERISKEKAAEISKAFLHKAIPNLKEGEYTPSNNLDQGGESLFGRKNYAFTYQLKINGLPSSGNAVHISVHDSGQVTSYTRMPGVNEYPSPTPKITQEEAQELLEKHLDIRLSYVPQNFSNSRHSYDLAYVPSSMGIANIDAVTGKLVDPYASEEVEAVLLDEPLPDKDLSFKPKTEPLNGDGSVALVKKYFPHLKNLKVADVSLSTNNGRGAAQKVWNLRFESNEPYGYREDISVQVDAATGRIMDYYEWSSIGQKEVDTSSKSISEQTAKSQAADLILSLVPNAAEEMRLSRVLTTEDGYTFVYSRYLNELPVVGDSATISMNKSGEVTTFYSNLNAQTDKLPETTVSKITLAEARETYLESIEMVLGYQEFGGYYNNEGERSAKLVYIPTQTDGQLYDSKVIDALTGKWRDLYAYAQNQSNAAVVDISGHPSEAVIERMIAYDVLVPNEEGKIEPERNITKGDWYTYLGRALDPAVETNGNYSRSSGKLYADIDADSPYYTVLNRLSEQAWIEPNPEETFAPHVKVTRGQLSEMIIDILQYDKLAKFYQQSTDLPNVADASQIDNKGAASLTIRFGILPLIEGRFLPDRPVTVSEAAEVINRLSELQGKLDYFMNNEWPYRYY